MHPHRKKRGFTLAETLLTVMIILILCGVAFLMVMRYLRSMAQLERDGIAKEIFVSAQNHLTMAESQGYLGKADYGTHDTSDEKDVYYFVVNGGGSFTGNRVLDLMLPFASVDETVRLGGSYIVRYQAGPALVLDVFYCSAEGTRFGHKLSDEGDDSDYSDALALRDTGGVSHKRERRTFGSDRAVLGWYGGEEALALETGKELKEPLVRLINAERLIAEVTDPNGIYELKLILKGEESGAQKAYTLQTNPADSNVTYDMIGGVYTVVLDDITTGGHHFSELFPDFIPGENLLVQAVAFSNSVKTNVAYSAQKTVNSLFADIRAEESAGTGAGTGTGNGSGTDSGAGTGSWTGGSTGTGTGSGAGTGKDRTAVISNLRHLENLDRALSGVNEEGSAVRVRSAVQTTDLDWDGFLDAIGPAPGGSLPSVYYRTGSSETTSAGCFSPVIPDVPLVYEGQSFSISNIRTDTAGDAGLFGALESESSVSNLLLKDFRIRSSAGNAGTLAASVQETEITNVLALGKEAVVTAKLHAGGLLGVMDGGTVTAGAAAVYVRSTGGGSAAGGLIGSASGSALVTGSYAGGHTEDGKYTDAEDKYNVTAGAGTAGGLVGTAGNTAFRACYSTCSVSGGTAGGFAGTAGGTVTNCYATGLVDQEAADPAGAGAFAGTFTGTASGCGYFEIINEKKADETAAGGTAGQNAQENTPGKGISYLTAGGDNRSINGVSPLDTDAASFDAFTKDPRADAGAYDDTLILYYQGKYSLRAVPQLDSTFAPEDGFFVGTHHGDWPSPELFFLNRRQ